MLGPYDDIYRMLPGGMQSRVPGGVPPSSPVGPMVGPPMAAFPGVTSAVPGGGGVPGSSPSSPGGGQGSGAKMPGLRAFGGLAGAGREGGYPVASLSGGSGTIGGVGEGGGFAYSPMLHHAALYPLGELLPPPPGGKGPPHVPGVPGPSDPTLPAHETEGERPTLPLPHHTPGIPDLALPRPGLFLPRGLRELYDRLRWMYLKEGATPPEWISLEDLHRALQDILREESYSELVTWVLALLWWVRSYLRRRATGSEYALLLPALERQPLNEGRLEAAVEWAVKSRIGREGTVAQGLEMWIFGDDYRDSASVLRRVAQAMRALKGVFTCERSWAGAFESLAGGDGSWTGLINSLKVDEEFYRREVSKRLRGDYKTLKDPKPR